MIIGLNNTLYVFSFQTENTKSYLCIFEDRCSRFFNIRFLWFQKCKLFYLERLTNGEIICGLKLFLADEAIWLHVIVKVFQ